MVLRTAYRARCREPDHAWSGRPVRILVKQIRCQILWQSGFFVYTIVQIFILLNLLGSLRITEGAGFSDSDEAGSPHPNSHLAVPVSASGVAGCWALHSCDGSVWLWSPIVSTLRVALFRFFRIAMWCDVIRGENPKQHEVAGHMMVLGISKHTSAILSTNFANNL